MLVLLSQMDFTVEFYYTYLSLFTLVTFYLNNSFVHSRKRRRKGIVPSIQFNVSDPASTSTSLLKLRLAFCDYLEKSHLIVCDFSILGWPREALYQLRIVTPSTFTSFAILLGPR